MVSVPFAACEQDLPQTVATTPPLDVKRLNAEMDEIAARAAPGVLGVGLMNLESGESWSMNGDRRFPMASVFKAPLGAAALGEVDTKHLDLAEVVEIRDIDLSPPFSPIAEAWPGRSTFTFGELLTAAVGQSDNTAADILMKRIGGPGVVTAWLDSKHVEEIRIDRYEREFPTDVLGLAPFRPAWKGEAAFSAALATVPASLRATRFAAYLADPRDTATPRGILSFLDSLDGGELISPASTKRLLDIMEATTTGPDRLKAGLPPGSRLAHKTGNSPSWQGVNAAANDIGLFTLPDGRRYALAVFLTRSTLDLPGRDKVIADVARAAVRGVR